MGRPKIYRRISKKPEHYCLNPEHKESKEELIKKEENKQTIEMNLDEYEAIRLGDYHNLKQKQSAELMGISQPTFHRILNSARKKIAISLIEGIEVEINNENHIKEDKIYLCESCGFQWNNPKKNYKFCPDCKSTNINIINLKENSINSSDITKSQNTSNSLIILENDENINCSDNYNEIPLNNRKSFGGLGSGKGPSKSCICPNCGTESPKIKGFPCKNMKCAKCGHPLCGLKK